jgi:hypothetical protein
MSVVGRKGRRAPGQTRLRSIQTFAIRPAEITSKTPAPKAIGRTIGGGSHRVTIAVLVDDLIRRTWTCNDYHIATAYELAENVARYAPAEGLEAGYWVARDVLTL